MKRFSIISALLLLMTSVLAEAKIVLPPVLSDNMVLQQKTTVKLWGKSEPGQTVQVTSSWNSKTVKAQADEDGKWLVKMQTIEAGGPYTIEVKDQDSKLMLKNVLLGEVWLCSGQSNMGMLMQGYPGQPVENALDYIISAKKETPIRMCHVKGWLAKEPVEKYTAFWEENTPEAVSHTSAAAYFMALQLQKALDVPVGILVAECGGSAIELWLDKETIDHYSYLLPAPSKNLNRGLQNILEKKTMHYNSKIYPIENYTIKGLVWYQGESNIDNVEAYNTLFPAYVKMMRDKWGIGEFPFYYVQISPHAYGNPSANKAAFMREAQMNALKTIPNSGMAVVIDEKNPSSIHPPKKEMVGKRLAYLALEKTYGFKNIDAQGPIYNSMVIEGDKIAISFKAGKLGIQPLGVNLSGFEIAGKDKIFYPAKAHIHMTRQVAIVYSDKVKEPVAVRYAFKNMPEASVFNISGVPASPFRTDDWNQ